MRDKFEPSTLETSIFIITDIHLFKEDKFSSPNLKEGGQLKIDKNEIKTTI